MRSTSLARSCRGPLGASALNQCVTASEVPLSRSPTTIPGLPSARPGASSVPPWPLRPPRNQASKVPRTSQRITDEGPDPEREDHQLACYTRVPRGRGLAQPSTRPWPRRPVSGVTPPFCGAPRGARDSRRARPNSHAAKLLPAGNCLSVPSEPARSSWRGRRPGRGGRALPYGNRGARSAHPAYDERLDPPEQDQRERQQGNPGRRQNPGCRRVRPQRGRAR